MYVLVTVKMNGGATFKGFMILSRRVDANEADNRAIGSFKKIPGSKHICSQVFLEFISNAFFLLIIDLRCQWM